MAYTTIKKPSDYFNTKLYTGTGSSLALTGIGHQPDFVWIKPRNEARGHHLFDAVRGVGKSIISNETSAEGTNAQTITAFGSDGFTVGTSNDVNKSSNTHVAWNWKANGAGSSNTDGSITSTVSANTTSGFSIVSYTGTGSNPSTVGHGLGVAPDMMIIKERSAVKSWYVYHKSLGNNSELYINATDSAPGSTSAWNTTSPTSSVFTINNAGVNDSGDTYIAYCFAEKQGFSKFGSYTGNGNADGTFVYTGFKPAFILQKRIDNVGSWNILDNKREGYNVDNNRLFPDTDGTENTLDIVDILSNGFKWRNTGSNYNNSGETNIYMAFAEEPLVGDNPATAR